MRKLLVSLLIGGLLLVGTFGLVQVASGQDGEPPAGLEVVQRESDGDNVREVLAPAGSGEVGAAAIGFIDSPTPYCYQPNPAQDVCRINWASMNVTASPDSMEVMTVTIKAVGVVARYQGYFQESISVSYQMNGNGFQVACGSPGAGGEAQLGNAYEWTIEGEDSQDNTTSNFGTLYCPPFNP
jgi:hypothetical protein